MTASNRNPLLRYGAVVCFIGTLVFIACDRPVRLGDRDYPANELVAPAGNGDIHRRHARSKRYMIATDAPEASEAGVEVYEAGGNIVDAAVAVSFAISVVRPHSTGLGGGGFLVMHLNAGDQESSGPQTLAFDFRERAPALATRNMYLQPDGTPEERSSLDGLRAVGVPGTVAGLLQLHAQYGRLSRAQVIAPALRLARDGFRVYPDLHDAIESNADRMDATMRSVFLPDGNPPAIDTLLRQPDLANTLEILAQDGASALYTKNGKLAIAIDTYMQRNGGLIRASDLSAYQVYRSAPLWSDYRDYRIATMPPPSSGVFILSMLHMLEQRDLNALYQNNRSGFYHYLTEVLRRGYRDRTELGGDPHFTRIPIDRLLDPARAEQLAADINMEEATPSADLELRTNRQPLVESMHTTHFSIMDADGNAIASTQSVNTSFGSGSMAPGTGMVLNNTMDDFSKAPGVPNAYGLIGGEANSIQAGKTPLSSMSPTIVFQKDSDGSLRTYLALGAPGGSRIITSILHTLIYQLDLNMHPYAAVARGRIHHQFLPDRVWVEKAAMPASGDDAPEALAEFGRLGHQVESIESTGSKVFSVTRTSDSLIGVSDPRGDGEPRGEPGNR
ncbi:MAG: gamma-glutamyltransferase [Leptospiraceae bacterium]|nr:gamma-glutamyltransferase [Leptospiraceae bacterium]